MNLKLFAPGFFALPLIGAAAMVVSQGLAVVGGAAALLQAEADRPAQEEARSNGEIHMPPGDLREFSWQTVLRPDQLNKRRRVRVVAYIDYGDLVEQKYQGAPPTEQNIYANIFAPAAAKQECERIRRVFAAQCVVDDARAFPMTPGRFQIDMNLLFTNKEAFGPPYSLAEALTFQETRPALTPPGGGQLLAFSQQESERMDMYRLAAQICERVRRNYGNCAIGDMELQAKQAGRTNDVLRMEARALLLTLQRKPPSAAAQ